MYEQLFQDFIGELQTGRFKDWKDELNELLRANFFEVNDGNLPRWLKQLALTEQSAPLRWQIDSKGAVEVASSNRTEETLRALMPWRKGPFQLGSIYIDSEWQCQKKWSRIAPHITDIKDATVLDVGSGNGYYLWQMRALGAAYTLGIDPALLSVCQHLLINQEIQDARVQVIPAKMEELPNNMELFDYVFSMGVLYHRRSPLDHLEELRQALRPGGRLILETLVIDGNATQCLIPPGRYARMNNVWFLPSAEALVAWCYKMGFERVSILDTSLTTPDEQRSTSWKPGTSLSDYLNPENLNQTLEGLPAPKRTIISAYRPESGRLPRYQL